MDKKNAVVRNTLTAGEFIKKADIACAFNGSSSHNNESFFNIEVADLLVENKHIIRADFSCSRLRNITFRSINFEGTSFDHTALEGIVFERCKLNYGSFDFAQMNNVQFIDCQNLRSSFNFASGKASFTRCIAEGLELHHVQAEMNFSQCAGQCSEFNYSPDLRVCADDCDFHQSQFNDSTISGRFSHCILSESDFLNSNCTGLDFVECKMRELNITDSIGIEIAVRDDQNDDEKFRTVFNILEGSSED